MRSPPPLPGGTPRTIWTFWRQGWEHAPELVRRCLRSWAHHNPGWTLRALDRDSLPAYAGIDEAVPLLADVRSIMTASDLARLDLLRAHGGVWVDATCFCRRPLDEWLPDHMNSGFFSFERHGWPTYWFMAAAPGNRLIETWRRESRAWWTGGPSRRLQASLANRGLIDKTLELARLLDHGRRRPRRVVDHALRPLGAFMRRHPGFRLSWPFRNVLGVASLYWMVLLFERSCQRHAHFREIWNATPKVGATGGVELGELEGLAAPLSDRARRDVDLARTPVYKLNRRIDPARVAPGAFLHYLLATIPDGPS